MEINSPPYPKNSGSPRDLFFNLTELYQWAAEQFDWANEEAIRLNAPDTPFKPVYTAGCTRYVYVVASLETHPREV